MMDLRYNLQDRSTELQVQLLSTLVTSSSDKLIYYSIDANLKYDLDILVGKMLEEQPILTHSSM